VDGLRPSSAAIIRIVTPVRRRSAITIRSSSDRNRAEIVIVLLVVITGG
jgi:hypothetical protein